MPKLTICRYPDAALANPCAPVSRFDEDLTALADDLYHTMRAAPGVGITAAHCGIALRIVILDLEELGGRRDYINPEVLRASPELAEYTEGSVSMPGVTETVSRPKEVTIRYQDLVGNTHEETLSDFPAICMQHEIDQLDGIFWIQRLSRLKRERLIKKWKKLSR